MSGLSYKKLLLIGVSAALLLTGCNTSTSTESSDDSGAIVAAPTAGELNISKMGGDIDVADAPGGAYLHTMGGGITVDKVQKSLDASTMGGDVTINSASVGNLNVKTMGGSIDITSAQASDLHATTMGGNVTVQTTGDGSIYLKSMGGNIELTIPKNSSAQIDAQIEYNGYSGRNFTITDNLGLQQQQSSNWDLWHLSPRKHLYAKGTIGSGQNHIYVKTYGGNVILNAQ